MIDADKLKEQLGAPEHRRILQRCDFRINGQSGPELSGVLGPKALGEGDTGNFSVDLQDGLVKDWGSSGYEGHVFNVVMDVHGLTFPEALEWIVDELGLDAGALQSENGSTRSTRSTSTRLTSTRSAPRGDGRASGRPEMPEASNGLPKPPDDPEPVVTHEQVSKWHGRLMGEGEAPRAARRYLKGRAVTEGAMKAAHVGLAHSPGDRRAEFWIMIPVSRRDLEEAPVVAVKGFAFDPEAGGWKHKDGRKIPRNAGSAALLDLVDATRDADSPVVICEGELDALSAYAQGFHAVTGTGGAGTFKPEWAPYIADLAPAKENGVVVAYDGDETGREGARAAAQRLYEAELDVRIAPLPDGQDVNDILVSGGETDLHDHLAQAEPYTPPEPEDEHQDEASGPDVQPLLGTEEPDPMEWRVADFVPEDHLTMLIGDGGTGKSILALHLALCICTGRPFLGMGTKKGRVLYIDHELDREEQLRRVHRIARPMGIDASDSSLSDRFQYWRPTHPLGSEEHQESLLEAVDAHEIDLVILDSLTMGAQGDVTDVADVVPIMQDVREWPTTVAIDHVSHSTAKGSASQARAFGSVFKRNAARSSLTLAQADTGGYCIQQEKSNFSDGDGRLTYAVEWGEDEITFDSISDADERAAGLLSDLSSKDVTAVAVEEMWDASQQPVMPSDVVTWRQEHVEGNKVQTEKAVRNHFSALKRKGKIVTDQHGGAMPAKAKHEPSSGTSDEDGEAPF